MKKIEIKDFARRVEHLCDFFLSKTEANGSKDRKIIEDLKEDAADIQFDQAEVASGVFTGLNDYMHGILTTPEENIGKESE
jgi:hypothetical protein